MEEYIQEIAVPADVANFAREEDNGEEDEDR
jgi:hypothetical protein